MQKKYGYIKFIHTMNCLICELFIYLFLQVAYPTSRILKVQMLITCISMRISSFGFHLWDVIFFFFFFFFFSVLLASIVYDNFPLSYVMIESLIL